MRANGGDPLPFRSQQIYQCIGETPSAAIRDAWRSANDMTRPSSLAHRATFMARFDRGIRACAAAG